ncbi:MAG: hypothetical protein ABI682_00235 [Acidobacteriota bacterium]
MAFPGALRTNTRNSRVPQAEDLPAAARRCRKKFRRFFPGGFRDETYLDWERNYKAAAHDQWEQSLGHDQYRTLLKAGRFEEIAALAVRIESKTNLLFSFEKMALRDAVKPAAGARLFAEGLYEFLHGDRNPEKSFERWCAVVGSLPRRQTRVLTWPVVTVFGEPPEIRRPGPIRFKGPAAERHDRPPVLPLGAGVGRVRLTVASAHSGTCRSPCANRTGESHSTSGSTARLLPAGSRFASLSTTGTCAPVPLLTARADGRVKGRFWLRRSWGPTDP